MSGPLALLHARRALLRTQFTCFTDTSAGAGLDPSRSCMLVARFLGDAGQFEDAEDLIKVPFCISLLALLVQKSNPDTLRTQRI